MNRKAQLFAIDLLLAFIPLTIMLGMSANALSGMAVQVQDYANIYSLQRKTNDAADVLIKSPGTPPNWNSTIHPTVSGLAYYDNSTGRSYTNRIYSSKVYALSISDLENLTGTSNSYLNISLITLQSSYEVGSDAPGNAIDIAVAERYSNFQLAGDFGPFVQLEDVDNSGDNDPECVAMLGPGSGACAYDEVTDLETDGADFYLYVEEIDKISSAKVMVGNDTNNITFFGTQDMDMCGSFKSCSNADDDANCILGGPSPSGYIIYSKFVYTLNDNTEFTPVSPNTLTSTHGSNACKNPPGNPTVYKTTAIVKLPDGFIQQFNQLAVRSTANINGPLNVYGIKVPVGTSWEFVNPDAFPNVMYPVRLTLKVWTE